MTGATAGLPSSVSFDVEFKIRRYFVVDELLLFTVFLLGYALLTQPTTYFCTFSLPFHRPFNGCAHIGWAFGNDDASGFEGFDFLVSSPLPSRNDRTSMSHAFARRGGFASNEGCDRFSNMFADIFSGINFSCPTNFTDHQNRFGFRIVFEHIEQVDE